ncbi:MAG: hypothetical protein SGPRY_008963, partial [Prymnesium sp.]
GACLGFAPEGVSRFLPYMEQPLKTGVARIAIEAIQQARASCSMCNGWFTPSGCPPVS